jgi:hypothetical protein
MKLQKTNSACFTFPLMPFSTKQIKPTIFTTPMIWNTISPSMLSSILTNF